MELNFKKKQLNLDLYGEKVALTFPTVREFQSYESAIREGNDDFKVMVSFLCSLGMTEDQINNCYPDDLKSIVDALSGVSKK